MSKGNRIPADDRRARFVKEYLIDKNATRAAIASGYSEKTARQAGSRLLADVNISAEIVKKREKVNNKLDVSIERVTLELARLAFFDARKFFREDGTALPITELDEDTARAVAGFEVEEEFSGKGEDRQLIGYIKKFKLPDKGQNLERLGRHLQMFPSPPQELKFTNDATDSTKRLVELLAAAASRVGDSVDGSGKERSSKPAGRKQ
jgi:phage terminase small subunit